MSSTVPDLPAAGTLVTSDLFYLVQQSGTVDTRLTLAALQAFLTVGPAPLPVRVITTPGDVTVTTADGYVVIDNNAVTNAIIDPSSFTVGVLVTIKVGANAGTFPVTVAPVTGTIDGQSSFVMGVGYMAIGIVNTGVELSIV